jgi:hypothetical protein
LCYFFGIPIELFKKAAKVFYFYNDFLTYVKLDKIRF